MQLVPLWSSIALLIMKKVIVQKKTEVSHNAGEAPLDLHTISNIFTYLYTASISKNQFVDSSIIHNGAGKKIEQMRNY